MNKNGKHAIRQLRLLPAALIAAAVLFSCTTIDCPLNNLVHTKFVMMGDVDTLKDTLNVIALRQDGTDTILYNLGVNTTSLSLPISYQQTEDQLVFLVTDTTTKVTTSDTLRITKLNSPHFESTECPPTFFHEITAVSTTHHQIDSVVINNPHVDNDNQKEHIYIYYRPRD